MGQLAPNEIKNKFKCFFHSSYVYNLKYYLVFIYVIKTKGVLIHQVISLDYDEFTRYIEHDLLEKQ